MAKRIVYRSLPLPLTNEQAKQAVLYNSSKYHSSITAVPTVTPQSHNNNKTSFLSQFCLLLRPVKKSNLSQPDLGKADVKAISTTSVGEMDTIVRGTDGSGSTGGAEASRTPSRSDSAETWEGDDCFDTSTDLANLDATSFPGGPSYLSLILSFRHHVLLDIWRSKGSVTVSNAFDMADRFIACLSRADDTYETTGTATQSERGITSTGATR
ncbi:hypothetical protein Syun_019946 [Stephania yunnanensis]|uniref:Uncharacterized protein n=1 Tax=Stephania yunnanensis TaxID=152371 RepID=A0AAP0IV52_9MAGN